MVSVLEHTTAQSFLRKLTEVNSFTDAFFLSMETFMTIGYGVPDPFFSNCDGVMTVLRGWLHTCLHSTL